MAGIEPPAELVELQRAADAAGAAAGAAATENGYSPEVWRLWLDAAEAVQAAITAHAREAGLNRYELERAVKTKARLTEPEG
ncbi:hypothetical protein [Streptomyces sp. NPDC002187]|uniref:hypothetical protein n=1 Tax=Streptomyces sp. NPDC002187 TaxID=3364637 RepID=UPI0036D1C0FA